MFICFINNWKRLLKFQSIFIFENITKITINIQLNNREEMEKCQFLFLKKSEPKREKKDFPHLEINIKEGQQTDLLQLLWIDDEQTPFTKNRFFKKIMKQISEDSSNLSILVFTYKYLIRNSLVYARIDFIKALLKTYRKDSASFVSICNQVSFINIILSQLIDIHSSFIQKLDLIQILTFCLSNCYKNGNIQLISQISQWLKKLQQFIKQKLQCQNQSPQIQANNVSLQILLLTAFFISIKNHRYLKLSQSRISEINRSMVEEFIQAQIESKVIKRYINLFFILNDTTKLIYKEKQQENLSVQQIYFPQVFIKGFMNRYLLILGSIQHYHCQTILILNKYFSKQLSQKNIIKSQQKQQRQQKQFQMKRSCINRPYDRYSKKYKQQFQEKPSLSAKKDSHQEEKTFTLECLNQGILKNILICQENCQNYHQLLFLIDQVNQLPLEQEFLDQWTIEYLFKPKTHSHKNQFAINSLTNIKKMIPSNLRLTFFDYFCRYVKSQVSLLKDCSKDLQYKQFLNLKRICQMITKFEQLLKIQSDSSKNTKSNSPQLSQQNKLQNTFANSQKQQQLLIQIQCLLVSKIAKIIQTSSQSIFNNNESTQSQDELQVEQYLYLQHFQSRQAINIQNMIISNQCQSYPLHLLSKILKFQLIKETQLMMAQKQMIRSVILKSKENYCKLQFVLDKLFYLLEISSIHLAKVYASLVADFDKNMSQHISLFFDVYLNEIINQYRRMSKLSEQTYTKLNPYFITILNKTLKLISKTFSTPQRSLLSTIKPYQRATKSLQILLQFVFLCETVIQLTKEESYRGYEEKIDKTCDLCIQIILKITLSQEEYVKRILSEQINQNFIKNQNSKIVNLLQIKLSQSKSINLLKELKLTQVI